MVARKISSRECGAIINGDRLAIDMTKREYFVAQAMKGILNGRSADLSGLLGVVPEWAANLADEVLLRLEGPENHPESSPTPTE